VLRQIFDDRTLSDTLGMVNQCRMITQGQGGEKMPVSLLQQFKSGAAAPLRRDQFVFIDAIAKEHASIELVKLTQVRVHHSLRTLHHPLQRWEMMALTAAATAVGCVQQRFVAVLGSILLSAFIGLSNLASMYYFESHSS
jgi:hypothetical protein